MSTMAPVENARRRKSSATLTLWYDTDPLEASKLSERAPEAS